MSRKGIRIAEPSGREVALVQEGSAATIYFAGRKDAVAHPISLHSALKLAFFILVQWWFLSTFCGLKLRWYEWKLGREMRRGLRASD